MRAEVGLLVRSASIGVHSVRGSVCHALRLQKAAVRPDYVGYILVAEYIYHVTQHRDRDSPLLRDLIVDQVRTGYATITCDPPSQCLTVLRASDVEPG